MKKLVLFGIVMSTIGFLNAQSLQIFHGEEDVTSTTIDIEVSADTDPAVLHLDVKNNSENAIGVKVRKIEETLVNGTSISLCWGINCYSPGQFETPTAASIEAGATDDSFHGDYFHFGYTGTTTVMYVFFDDANPDDSVAVTVNYTLEATSVDLFELSNFSLPYPNPANETVHFYYSVDNGVSLKIYNTIGKLVKSVELSNIVNELEVSTQDFLPGTYFYEIERKNIVLDKGKIIVTR